MALIYYAYKFFSGMCSPKDDVPQLSEQQQYDQHHQQRGPVGSGGTENGDNGYPPQALSYVSGGPDGEQPGPASGTGPHGQYNDGQQNQGPGNAGK